MRFGIAIEGLDSERWMWPLVRELSFPVSMYLQMCLERTTVGPDPLWRSNFLRLAGQLDVGTMAPVEYGVLGVAEEGTYGHFSRQCNGNPRYDGLVVANDTHDATAMRALGILNLHSRALEERVHDWMPLAPVFRQLDLPVEWVLAMGCYPREWYTVFMTNSYDRYHQIAEAAQTHAGERGVREFWDDVHAGYFDLRKDRLEWSFTKVEPPDRGGQKR